MAKKESTFMNMVFTLFIVTLSASTALGFVYNLTKEPIENAKIAKKNNAIMAVVPEFDNNPSQEEIKVGVNGDSLLFYPAFNMGKLVGMAVETFTNKGFSGEIKLMVGLLPNGTIHDVTVLEHKETPGLGDKMENKKSDFSEQFKNKNPLEFDLRVKKDGGDVDAITAATISARAYCDAVEKAFNAYKENKDIFDQLSK